jgi:polyisoprenoid-binding protein YceI
MTSTALTVTPGTYHLDPIHSSADFAVRHKVSKFRGSFTELDGTLHVAETGEIRLSGTAKVASIVVKSGDMEADLLSPNFFDAERYPVISFESTNVSVADDGATTVTGDLTMRGHTESVTAAGRVSTVDDDGHGRRLVGIDLETVVDRTRFGISFVQQLPGGGAAVETEVTLNVELEFAST